MKVAFQAPGPLLMKVIICMVLALALLAACGKQSPPLSQPAADLVIRNARIWTGDSLQPEATALAIRGDRIVAVGGNDNVEGLIGAETELLDGPAGLVVPGFIDRRARIEHAQHLRPEEISRVAADNNIPSMQPYYAIDDGRWAESVIGPVRARHTYAFNSLLESGVRVAFGSDWSVAPADPIAGIYAATTRRTLDGAHPDGWVPEKKEVSNRPCLPIR